MRVFLVLAIVLAVAAAGKKPRRGRGGFYYNGHGPHGPSPRPPYQNQFFQLQHPAFGKPPGPKILAQQTHHYEHYAPAPPSHGHSSGHGHSLQQSYAIANFNYVSDAPSSGYSGNQGSSYGAPAAPVAEYGAPSAAYGAPAAEYGAPAQSAAYGAPAQSAEYGAPAQSAAYGSPAQSAEYGAPAPSAEYGGGAPLSPSVDYGSPSFLEALPTQVSKSVYVFSAPPDPFDKVQPQLVKKFPAAQRQKHYQVVFINAPNPPPPAQHTVELPPPPELKTQIYVLVKKPQAAPPLKIIPAKVPINKPEVFFIRYKNKDGGYSQLPVPHGSHPEGPVEVVSGEGGYGPGPVDVGPGPIEVSPGYGGPEEQFQPAPGPSAEYGAPVHEYGGPVVEDHGAPVQEYESPASGYVEAPASEYAPEHGYASQAVEEQGPDYGAPVSEYVTQSGAFGYDPSGNGAGVHDMYSDYSRLSAHYAGLKGVKVRPLRPILASWKRNFANKNQKKSKIASRMDDNNSKKWTPIISKKSNRELDAGISGI